MKPKFTLTVMLTLALLQFNEAMAQTLLAHWTMNDPSSINPTNSSTPPTADASGNGYTASFRPAAGPGPVAGVTSANAGLGTGFSFNGTDQDLLVTTMTLVNSLQSTFTLAGWINTNAAGTHYMLGFDGTFPQNNNGVRFGVYSSNTGLVLTLGGVADYELIGAPYTGPNPISSNVWHHVCVVVTGSNADATFYLDGVNVGTLAGSGPAAPKNAQYVIGANPIFGNFGRVNGSLDDLRIYNGALTPAQVAALVGISAVEDWACYE